jgi:hypothetical protein
MSERIDAMSANELTQAYVRDMNEQVRAKTLIGLITKEAQEAKNTASDYTLENMLDNPLVWDSHKMSLMRRLTTMVINLQAYNLNTPIGIPDVMVSYLPLLPYIHDIKDVDDVTTEIQAACQTPLGIVDHTVVIQDSGYPIWERLPGENDVYYRLFRQYCDMKVQSGSRSVHSIIDSNNASADVINTIYRLFHWKMRIKAHDLHMTYTIEAEVAFKRNAMAGRHATAAENMLAFVTERITKNPELLKGSDLVKLFEQSMTAERLALGMSGKGEKATIINNDIRVSNPGSDMTFGSIQANGEVGIQEAVVPKNDDAMLEIINVLIDADALQPKIPEEDFDQTLADMEETTLDPQKVEDIIENTEIAPLAVMDDHKGEVVYMERDNREESFFDLKKKLEAKRKAEK